MIFLILAVLIFMAILNAIIPLPGFSFFIPLLSTVMSTQGALTFATIYFLISSSIIVFVFRKYLRKELIILLLPASIIGALAGSFFSAALNEKLLTAVIFIFVVYFLIKKIRALKQPTDKEVKKSSKKERHTVAFVGIVSGFLQGGGLGGGDVRNGFLYAKGLTMQEVRATTAAVGVGNFLIAMITRGATGHIVIEQLWVFLVMIPLLVGATYIARHITTKLNHKMQNGIVVGLMVVAVGLLVIKLVQ
ncbi:MAG: sulfite exporter TauE/SafE family protein [Candidatus Saccharibacteria bacterium]|nr:sulfite exporter TauE/SafE family protein [Candidatus Saccharibacteria bacterium]